MYRIAPCAGYYKVMLQINGAAIDIILQVRMEKSMGTLTNDDVEAAKAALSSLQQAYSVVRRVYYAGNCDGGFGEAPAFPNPELPNPGPN